MRSAAIRSARRWVASRAETNAGEITPVPLDLGQLISPLRLDVLIRASLFEAWALDWSVVRSRPDRALEIASSHPYRQWFDLVAVSKITGATEPATDVDEAFAWRVRRSHKLLDAFIRDGFDERHPVTVKRHRGGEHASGKVLGPRIYPVDGCHRIALLWASGVRTLSPSLYRLLPEESPTRDNTSSLLRGLTMTSEDYFRFVGLGYGAPDATSAEQLSAAVPVGDPRRGEIESVVLADKDIRLPGGRAAPSEGVSP